MKTYRCYRTVLNPFTRDPIFKEDKFYVGTFNEVVNKYTFLTYEDSEKYPDTKLIIVSKKKFKEHFRREKTLTMKLYYALK